MLLSCGIVLGVKILYAAGIRACPGMCTGCVIWSVEGPAGTHMFIIGIVYVGCSGIGVCGVYS